MEPLVHQAKRHRGGQPPVLPDRMFFEAFLYLARTGIPLRDLPSEFRRWDASGALVRLFEQIPADPQFGEVYRVLVDSTRSRVGSSSGTRCWDGPAARTSTTSAMSWTPPKPRFGRPPRLLAADRGESGVEQVTRPHVGQPPPQRRAERTVCPPAVGTDTGAAWSQRHRDPELKSGIRHNRQNRQSSDLT